MRRGRGVAGDQDDAGVLVGALAARTTSSPSTPGRLMSVRTRSKLPLVTWTMASPFVLEETHSPAGRRSWKIWTRGLVVDHEIRG